MPEGTKVTVYFSDGPEKVPNVVGLQEAAAEKALRDAGFVPVVVESNNTEEPKGTVIQQIPGDGQPKPEGTEVTIVVSTFEPPTETPTPTPTDTPTATPTDTADRVAERRGRDALTAGAAISWSSPTAWRR